MRGQLGVHEEVIQASDRFLQGDPDLPHFLGFELNAASEQGWLFYNHCRRKSILPWENYLGNGKIRAKLRNTHRCGKCGWPAESDLLNGTIEEHCQRWSSLSKGMNTLTLGSNTSMHTTLHKALSMMAQHRVGDGRTQKAFWMNTASLISLLL